MTDASLIKELLRYQSDFMAYLMAITRDLDAAEEVFQNAAVVVAEKGAGDEEIHNFRAWAKEVVRRQALHHRPGGAPQGAAVVAIVAAG